jgi:hypothetical protein
MEATATVVGGAVAHRGGVKRIHRGTTGGGKREMKAGAGDIDRRLLPFEREFVLIVLESVADEPFAIANRR